MFTGIAILIGAILSAVVGISAAALNSESVDKTNEANLTAVRETNAANVEQANLAYERSRPQSQIADMINAGISAPAAMQKIAGGGSYAMPTLQAGTSQAKQIDLSSVGAAFERMGNIPAAVEQSKMQNLELENLRQEMLLRKEAAEREEESHKFDMWQKLYGKDATMSIDALSSQIVQMAADKGISLDSIDSIDQLRKSFDLDNNKIWRTMPNMARTQVLDGVRLQAFENRARVAAQDSHDLAEFEKSLKKTDLNERQQSLVYKLALLSQQVELGKLSIDRENYEKTLRDVGFENKKEAAEAFAAAENLRSTYEREKSRRLANSNSILPVIDLMLEKLNPLREIIKIGQ